MYRRRLLAATGLAVLGGCTGDDSDGTGVATDSRDPASAATTEAPTTTADAAAATETTAAVDQTEPAGGDGTESGDEGPSRRTGVSLSPRSYEGTQFQAFFEHATQTGSLLRWAGDWAALSDAGSAPHVLATLADRYGYRPVVEVGAYAVGDRELFRPLDDATVDAYVESAAAFAAASDLHALGVGVEVNVHATEDPESFETYLECYHRTYDAVKTAAPDTLVYPSVQYEWLQGRRGGLWGGEHDPETAQWALLDRFALRDRLAITTYPGLVFPDPADVPDDYYVRLADRVDDPLAVVETGWSAETVASGWESDEAEQARFVDRLFALTDGLDLRELLWLWLYDQPGDQTPFDGVTLRRSDGTPRPAWDRWLANVDTSR
jgi:hypothetical protein